VKKQQPDLREVLGGGTKISMNRILSFGI